MSSHRLTGIFGNDRFALFAKHCTIRSATLVMRNLMLHAIWAPLPSTQDHSRKLTGVTMRQLLTMSCFTVLLANLAFGQGDRGTITGTVMDPTGAVIAGARVTAQNVETHNVLETVTTATGNYTLPQVPVGAWDVVVAAAGFKQFRSLRNII